MGFTTQNWFGGPQPPHSMAVKGQTVTQKLPLVEVPWASGCGSLPSCPTARGPAHRGQLGGSSGSASSPTGPDKVSGTSSPHALGIQRVDRSPQSGDATPPGWGPRVLPHSERKGISEQEGGSALGRVVPSPQIDGIDFCPREMLRLLRCPRGSFVRKCRANGISSHAAITPEDEDFNGVWSREGHPSAPWSPAVSSWSTGRLSPPSGPTSHRRRSPKGSCPRAHRLTASDRVAWAQRVRVVTASVSPTSASLSQHPRGGRGLQAFSLLLPP